MGQYYEPVIKKPNGEITVFNRYLIIDGEKEYTMAKLTEHSWIGNYFMDSFCAMLYQHKEPLQIVWLGDYANEFMAANHYQFNSLGIDEFRKIFDLAYNEEKGKLTKELPYQEFDLTNKYIVNHSKQEYLDFNKYYQNSVMDSDGDKWCLHPLSILTCLGNGCGGGDYNSPTKDSTTECIGSWTWDSISIQDNKPENYHEITPIFKEQGWED